MELIKKPDLARWAEVRQWVVSLRWQPWLPVVTTYLLVVVLAYLLADLTWRSVGMFYGGEPVGPGSVASEAPEGPTRGSTAEQVAWKKFALFGPESDSAGVASTPRALARPVKPAEPVRLTLYGTIASDDPDLSLAVVAAKGGKAEIYRVGDELQRGVTLKSVSAWSVVVSVGGEDEIIAMIDVSQLPDRPVVPLPPVVRSSTTAAGERRITEPGVVQKLKEYRSTLETNPLSLMDKVRAYPVKRGGEPYGIRVRPGTDRALLGQVGLRSGDILIALNGVPLQDVKNLPDVLAQLKNQSEFSLQLERAGKRQDLRVVMDETGGR